MISGNQNISSQSYAGKSDRSVRVRPLRITKHFPLAVTQNTQHRVNGRQPTHVSRIPILCHAPIEFLCVSSAYRLQGFPIRFLEFFQPHFIHGVFIAELRTDMGEIHTRNQADPSSILPVCRNHLFQRGNESLHLRIAPGRFSMSDKPVERTHQDGNEQNRPDARKEILQKNRLKFDGVLGAMHEFILKGIHLQPAREFLHESCVRL